MGVFVQFIHLFSVTYAGVGSLTDTSSQEPGDRQFTGIIRFHYLVDIRNFEI